MKYVIQVEVSPEAGAKIEEHPEQIQALVEQVMSLHPLGFYAHMARRAMTIIVEAPNEDALFEVLHRAWVLTNSYPTVSPVVSVEEFPALLQRAGFMP